MSDKCALDALLTVVETAQREHVHERSEWDETPHCFRLACVRDLATRLDAAGVRVTGDAGLIDRVILAAFDVDGAWDAEDKDRAPILWHAEAGEVLADLRAAIEALDDGKPWYSVLTPTTDTHDLDGKPFCPTGFAQRYHAIGECDCPTADTPPPLPPANPSLMGDIQKGRKR